MQAKESKKRVEGWLWLRQMPAILSFASTQKWFPDATYAIRNCTNSNIALVAVWNILIVKRIRS